MCELTQITCSLATPDLLSPHIHVTGDHQPNWHRDFSGNAFSLSAQVSRPYRHPAGYAVYYQERPRAGRQKHHVWYSGFNDWSCCCPPEFVTVHLCRPQLQCHPHSMHDLHSLAVHRPISSVATWPRGQPSSAPTNLTSTISFI